MPWDRSSSSDSRHCLQMYSKRKICFKISKKWNAQISKVCPDVFSHYTLFPQSIRALNMTDWSSKNQDSSPEQSQNNEFGLECWSGKPCPEHGPDDFGSEKGFDVGEIISDSYFQTFMDILKQSPFGFTHFIIHPEIRCLQICYTKFQFCARFSPKTRFRLSLIQERARAYQWSQMSQFRATGAYFGMEIPILGKIN